MTPVFFHSPICFSGSLTLFWAGILQSELHRALQTVALYGFFDGGVVFSLLFSLLGWESSCDRGIDGSF
jgi:hypothetical protein